MLFDDMKQLEALEQKVEVPIKFIHVLNNPFDNVASMSLESFHHLKNVLEDFETIDIKHVMNLKEHTSENQWFELRVDKFIARTKETLGQLCTFLQLDTTPDYLTLADEGILQKPKSKSRDMVFWDPIAQFRINTMIKQYAIFCMDFRLINKSS